MPFDIADHDTVFEITKEERDEIDQLATKDDREKPGGSNAGKYKKGPFCGPSGGAPKGTYPVDTRKRAISAISYARHAPNPAGIKKCVCSHWPDLPACKTSDKKEKQSMATEMKLPKSALHFMDHEGFARIQNDADGNEGFQMVAYSGGVIPKHWYWGDLLIDLEGMKFPKATYPILESHNTDRKIAFANKPDLSLGALEFKSAKFVDTPASEEFRKLSKEGFPFEASIYAVPTAVERIDAGEKGEANGLSVKGPASIWRKSVFKEASVCVFGYDSNTRSTAFADEDIELTIESIGDSMAETHNLHTARGRAKEKEVKDKMPNTIAELKAESPDLYQQMADEIRQEVERDLRASFDAEKTGLEDQVAGLKSQLQEKDESNQKLEARVLKLEKNEYIRTEQEKQSRVNMAAERVWTRALAVCDIPEHMHEKVRAMVKADAFVKEDVLDEDAFSQAVQEEIDEWEGKGMTTKVLGTGFSKSGGNIDPDAKTEEQMKAEDDEWLKEMLALGGQAEKGGDA
jgi:hypothetical protein